MSSRPRSVAPASALALVGLLGLAACTSTPSQRRVVLDQIEALDLSADAERCMNEVVGGYTDDELDDIATGGENEDIDWDLENAVATGTPELQEFVAELTVCVAGGAEPTAATATSDATATTETADTETADTETADTETADTETPDTTAG